MSTPFCVPRDGFTATLNGSYAAGGTTVPFALSSAGRDPGTPTAPAPIRFAMISVNAFDPVGRITDWSTWGLYTATGRSGNTLTGVAFTGTGADAATRASGDRIWSDITADDLNAVIAAVSAAPGTGTVTSVALAAPSWLAVAGSPVTGAGTVTLSADATQAANSVLATPNGVTGALTVRPLVAADVPALAEGKVTGLVADLAARLVAASNLSDVASASSARTNLGLGTAATHPAADFLLAASNLSDVASTTTARTNLGLGTAATHASTDFLLAASNLGDLASAPSARTSLGLGTAATHPATDFLTAASNLSDVASASTARTNLALVPGTNIQAYSATLAGLASASYGSTAILIGQGTGTPGTLTGSGLVKLSGGTPAVAVANTDYLPVASPTATGTLTAAAVSATGTVTVTGAPVVRPFVALADASAVNVDCTTGDLFSLTTAAARTLAVKNIVSGMSIRLRLTTGGFQPTFGGAGAATLTWVAAGAVQPTFSSAVVYLLFVGTGAGTADVLLGSPS